ncbi:MAG: hypothetical protein QME75_09065 [Deltaproteobacteria bacterium]|nr:hypothetical protein [Deltaproteobacteria bacterium]
MEQIKCPGQDTRHWKPGDIFTAECPKCGAEIEFFKDDTRRRCAWCGHLFYNPKIELGCAEWCQYADKCVPDLVKEKQAMQSFKEILLTKVKDILAGDAAGRERLDQAVKYAAELLKAEGGDPKVVFAAVILKPVSLSQARELLAELETEPEIAADVISILDGSAPEKDANARLVQDVLTLVAAKPEEGRQFATRTAQRLAAAAVS